MEWALADLPGVDDLIEFESRVNYIVPGTTTSDIAQMR